MFDLIGLICLLFSGTALLVGGNGRTYLFIHTNYSRLRVEKVSRVLSIILIIR
jgi:hypothetical protein